MYKLICENNHCTVTWFSIDQKQKVMYMQEKRTYIQKLLKEAKEQGLTNERETRSSYSMSRARKRINEILIDNITPFSAFMTLTFADNISNVKYCQYKFMAFISNIKKLYGISLSYLAVKEYQKRGAIHFHLIVFNYTHNFLNWIFEKEKIIQPHWKHGFAHIKMIDNFDDLSKITNYMGKYMSKQKMESGKKLYFTSRDIKTQKDDYVLTDEAYSELMKTQEHNILTYNVSGIQYTKIIFDKKEAVIKHGKTFEQFTHDYFN